MKRGGYDLGHYIVYFIVAMVLIALPILTIRAYTTKGFYEHQQESQQARDYLFSRALVDCLDGQDHVFGKLATADFTDARLRSCTSEPVSITLQQAGATSLLTIATDDSLKQYTSLRTLRQETILVDGKRSVLTVGVKDA